MSQMLGNRLGSIQVTPSLAAFVVSLLLGLPFAIGWASDSEHFPSTLKWMVMLAAAIHVASLAGRIIALKLTGFRIRGAVLRVLAAYTIWGLAAIGFWKSNLLGLNRFATLLLDLPFGYGLYLVGYVMTVDPPAEQSDRAEVARASDRT